MDPNEANKRFPNYKSPQQYAANAERQRQANIRKIERDRVATKAGLLVGLNELFLILNARGKDLLEPIEVIRSAFNRRLSVEAGWRLQSSASSTDFSGNVAQNIPARHFVMTEGREIGWAGEASTSGPLTVHRASNQRLYPLSERGIEHLNLILPDLENINTITNQLPPTAEL